MNRGHFNRVRPNVQCSRSIELAVAQFHGQSTGVWNMDDWDCIDNTAQSVFWMDHSISAWDNTSTQCTLTTLTMTSS
eukprot:3265604-Amphidinium_carterae.1